MAILAGGAIDSVRFNFDGGGGKILATSPYLIISYLLSLDYLGIIIIAAIVANPVYRDFEYNAHSLFFTKPLSKWDYLGGRFLGSCAIAVFVLIGMAMGLILGSVMPFLNKDMVGPIHLLYYIQPYITIIIPNLLFMGMIFFMLATLMRNMLPVYVGSVVLLILLGVAGQLTSTIKNDFLAALLDPTGADAIDYITKYWTVAQKNSNLIPFSGALLYNRIIWVGVAALLFAILFYRFRFDQFSSEIRIKKNNRTVLDKAGAYVATVVNVHQHFTFKTHLTQYFKMSWLELRNILRSPYFIAITFAGMVLMFVSGRQFGKMYDTNTYPVTGMISMGLAGIFSMFMIIILIFYSGEMVWKERELKLSQIYDTLPIPGWVGFASKLTALVSVQAILLLIVMFCGIIIQSFFGYYNFEIPVYLKTLFGIFFIGLVLWSVLALFIQVLVNQKFLGFFIVIVFYLFTKIFMDMLGLNHHLYQYGTSPNGQYSDMNGYSGIWTSFLWFKFYWVCFAVMLAVVANLFWVRGITDGFKSRWQTAKTRFAGPTRSIFFIALALFLGSGTYIFYNTNILNHYTKSYDEEKLLVEYEKKYKKYDHLPQPRIIAMNVNADLYPYEGKVHFKAYYILKNKTNHPIDSLHILLGDDKIKYTIAFSNFPDSIHSADSIGRIIKHQIPQLFEAALVLKDSVLGYSIYKLPQPLMPQDSIKMDFTMDLAHKGFGNNSAISALCENGTFLSSESLSFPHLGYNEDGEVDNNIERKKFGLPYKEPLPAFTDTNAVKQNLVTQDADWIRYDAVISTSGDQTAITSGDLVKKWTSNGRNYFQYHSPSKILCFVPFVSARYQVKEDSADNVHLAIYYNKGDEYNLNRMMQGLKDGLDYYTKNFSPYQFKQVKILEFPYASFAQSFANTIPFSENIGFIANVNDDDPEDIDYPYYVTAHELGHQWWAHQVIGGKVQGVTMLDETMAQYSAMMIMKHRFGANKMKKFLQYEMNNYLRARGFEREKEVPLYRVENQQYIHYNKGSVVMYALQDFIGELNLDSALHKYIKKVAFQEPPYTTTPQFLQYVSAATPDSLKYVIRDMFESIVIYNNKVTEATYKKVNDSTYKVHLVVDAHKVIADSTGNEKETTMNDWINIGVFKEPKKGEMIPLYMRKMKITSSPMAFDLTVRGGKPYEAGIDPYNELIDRMPDDNIKVLEESK
jgi:ABC-type transport system involved in multi-copper enzyme maturation permease subunit